MGGGVTKLADDEVIVRICLASKVAQGQAVVERPVAGVSAVLELGLPCPHQDPMPLS